MAAGTKVKLPGVALISGRSEFGRLGLQGSRSAAMENQKQQQRQRQQQEQKAAYREGSTPMSNDFTSHLNPLLLPIPTTPLLSSLTSQSLQHDW